MDRSAPSGTTNLELHFVVKAVMTWCGSSGRRLATGVPQVVQVEKTHPLSTDACQQSSSRACAKAKCVWIPNPAQGAEVPVATCVAKSTVARWACPNILASTACASNPACVVKNKKCVFKQPNKKKSG
jgi:hypothetical protein